MSVKANELITSAERDKDEQNRRDKAAQREENERLNRTENYVKDYLKSLKDKQKHCDEKGDIISQKMMLEMCKSVQMQRVGDSDLDQVMQVLYKNLGQAVEESNLSALLTDSANPFLFRHLNIKSASIPTKKLISYQANKITDHFSTGSNLNSSGTTPDKQTSTQYPSSCPLCFRQFKESDHQTQRYLHVRDCEP